MRRVQQVILGLSFFFLSCENESFDTLIEKIDTNSELFANLKSLSETTSQESETICLTFVYPFNIYLYNEKGDISDNRIVNNNLEFTELLGQMQDKNSISLSYPISGTNENGDSISINNNFQLKQAIEACLEDQIIIYCNTILEEKNCVWNIKSQNENDLYDPALLDFYEDGTGIFYHNGNSFRTSWISLFIEQQLHINIHLEGDSTIAEDWNFDWKATIIDENTVIINNNEQRYQIRKNCDFENNCDYLEFRACEIEDSENTAEFIFDEYLDCIVSFDENSDMTTTELSFYETIEDANMQLNVLDTNSYNNTTNPQIIFVRKQDINEETVEIIRIVLFVETCNE